MKKSKTEELNKLFKEWIENQKDKIEKGKKLHKFFAKDGIICEEEYGKSGTRILFILKEPNIMKDLIDENYDDDQRKFYNDFFNNKFYDEINIEDENRVLKAIRNDILIKRGILEIKENKKEKKYYYPFDNIPVKQKEKIARMAKYIINQNITDDYETLKNALKQIAFMNLNKSGGDATSDKEYFSKYYEDEDFSNYICKEIEILDPEIIVLIGAKSYKNGDKYLSNKQINSLFNEKKVIEVVHTAARGKALNIHKDEKEILKQKFKTKYNDNLDEMHNNIVQTDKSKLHMKYDRGVFKFFLKFVAAYEKNAQKISKEGNL